MGRLSTRSNPTQLRELEKSRVNISVLMTGGRRFFTLDRLNTDGLGLAGDLAVLCIARAGRSSRRYELGSLSHWNRESQSLDGIDGAESLRFRILIRTHDSPQLVASAEGIRPMDDFQSESLLPMEPAELGERLWKLDIGDDGPVLRFNVSVFPSAAGVDNFPAFSPLVMPEALHQILKFIAEDPSVIDKENEAWGAWGEWLDSIGADKPPETDDEYERWCSEVAAIFCEKHRFASRMRQSLTQGEGE